MDTSTAVATAPTPDDYATHSALSDPGRHARALADLATDPASVHDFVTGAVVHYYAGMPTLTARQIADVDQRWIAAKLDAAAERAPELPLSSHRELGRKIGGCCRDFSLLAVAVLREHGIPARTRLGFADYLQEGFSTDHVVVERYDGARWVRSDPQIAQAHHAFDTHDIPRGEDAPFATAAELWLAHREGRRDLSTAGASPARPLLTGPGFVQRYVLGDLAHRQRCELLLWDTWGAMTTFGAEPDAATVELTDEVAALTIRADGGDRDAEEGLARLWQDERLRPARYVATFSPTGRLGWTDLVARSTSWARIDLPTGELTAQAG